MTDTARPRQRLRGYGQASCFARYAVVLLLAIAVLAACSGDDRDASARVSDEHPSQTSSQATESTTTIAPQSPPFVPVGTWSWSIDSGDGFTYEIEFAVGPYERAQDVVTPAGFPPFSMQCDANPERDAVVPWKVTIISTTSEFQVEPWLPMDFRFDYDTTDPNNPYAVSLQQFGTASQCNTGRDQGGGRNEALDASFNGISGGQQIEGHGYAIVSDIYSPASPNGDLSFLRQIFLGDIRRGVEPEGPGVTAVEGFTVFPLQPQL